MSFAPAGHAKTIVIADGDTLPQCREFR